MCKSWDEEGKEDNTCNEASLVYFIHEEDEVVNLSERVAGGGDDAAKMKQRHKLHVYMKTSSVGAPLSIPPSCKAQFVEY